MDSRSWFFLPSSNATATLRCSVAVATFSVAIACSLGDRRHAFAAENGSRVDCSVVCKAVFPQSTLATAGKTIDRARPIMFGGISSLAVIPQENDSGELIVRLITDRGPTSKLKTTNGNRRVFWNPAFVPSILTFSVTGFRSDSAISTLPLSVERLSTQTLHGLSGVSFTGHPNGLAGDETAFHPNGQEPLPADPNGIDPEALIVLRDGSAWLAEEYLPSLLRISSEAVVLSRYVPIGVKLKDADTQIHNTLPEHYRKRQPNRGFESVAVSPDEKVLWTMLQSPLAQEDSCTDHHGDVVRLLQLDSLTGQPQAEYLYKFGRPFDARHSGRGRPTNDGKVCAIACINAKSLLVLEQSDDGDAALYRCQLAGGTNTLGDDRLFEGIADLSDAGVEVVPKTLVADLRPLLPEFAHDITDGAWKPNANEPIAGLKLEGIAIVDQRHVAIVNDNDFNTNPPDDTNEPLRRSCLWIVALPVALQ